MDVQPLGGGMRGPILAPGTLIGGKFRIENRIARGGQASVYLARQEPLNRPVALKLLSPPSYEATAEEREGFEQRFLLEARTLASLDHPNIVTLFDYGETDDGRYYLAMEYIPGGRFLDLLKKGSLEYGRAVGLVLQVAQALRYAHKRGVVHRDVKNSNVLVRTLDNGEEQAKVVDFGLVKLSRVDSGLTQTGMILGSPHFMAPEQATGQAVDHRADIYATGVLLYCGLTGKYPFDGPHATAIITAHVTRDVPFFAAIAPTVRVPEGLEAIVRRCLEKRPGRRYPSMDALVAELMPYHSGPAIEGVTGEFNTLTLGQPIKPPRDWTAVWAGILVGGVILVIVVLLAATAVLGLQMRTSSTTPVPETVDVQPAVDKEPMAPVAVPEPVVSSDEAQVAPSPQPRAVRRARPRYQAPAPVVEPAAVVTPDPPPAPPVEENADDWADIDLEQPPDPWAEQ
jgi:tRNA A-37 threonylcarbamoyl transferase component Bud32